jgi:hypothetical protein
MKTFKFGVWEIEADVEATQEYYRNFDDAFANRQPPKERFLGNMADEEENSRHEACLQAYKNYKDFCKTLKTEEKDYFDSIGILPELVYQFSTLEIDKVGILQCSGFFPIVGRYTKTLDEIAMSRGDDIQEVPQPQVGRYSFYPIPKEEENMYDLLPDALRDALVLLWFFVDTPWFLEEKCMMKLFSMPRWWEIGKQIMRAKKNKRMDVEYREAVEDALLKIISPYNPVKLSQEETTELCERWFTSVVPAEKQKEARKNCFPKRKYWAFLWNAFGYVPCEEQEHAREKFDAADKSQGVFVLIQDCILHGTQLAYTVDSPHGIKALDFDDIIDVYVIARDFSFTYVHTHEEFCGPYFYKRE